MKNRQGFTLIEVSIVLVIIGLLVGGVLLGKDLIKSAETRAAIAEIEKLTLGINTFKLKYRYLPGDLPDATSYFSGVSNGNGDGRVLAYGGPNYQEMWQAYTMLSAANMIDGGPYTGAQGAGGSYHCVPGSNVLGSKTYNGTGYMFTDAASVVWPASYQFSPLPAGRWNGHVITIGRGDFDPAGTTTTQCVGAALTALEAYNVDTKLDDGKPGGGKIQVIYPGYHGWAWCVTGCPGGPCTPDPATSAYYSMTSGNRLCSLMYKVSN